MNKKHDSRMTARHKNRLFFVWLPVLLIVFMLNHIEYHFRIQSIADKSKNLRTVIVKAEGGQMGHSTIGVDENSIIRKSGKTFLHFSSLGTWDYNPENNNPPCPEAIMKLNGKLVTCIGFMYPLETGSKIKLFALLRTTQTCCYGPRPQYNQYLFVELKEPVEFERTRPVLVEGLFFVDPRPDEGYIYRLEATSATIIKDNMPDVNGAEAAEKADLKLFDFTLLEKMKTGKTEIPPELNQLNNCKVVVEGFLVGSTEDNLPRQIIGKYWWDGFTQGTPPDLYNAVMVFPKDKSQVPPAWKQKVVFTGMLNITEDEHLYADYGIISIRDAVRGVPGQNISGSLFDAGPILSVWHEAVILGVFLLLAFWKSGFFRKRTQSAG